MPQNYDPTVDPGDTRRRINRGQIENPSGGIPWILWHEEEVIRTADGEEVTLIKRTRGLKTDYTPGATVEVRNPITDAVEPVGRLPDDLTHEEIQAVLYSHGRASQIAQDAIDDAAGDSQ